jgi:hypothetical protein
MEKTTIFPFNDRRLMMMMMMMMVMAGRGDLQLNVDS